MRRARAASAVLLMMIVVACGTDKTDEFLASRTTTGSAVRTGPTTSTTGAKGSTTTVAAASANDVGTSVTLEQRQNGVSSMSKYTLKSTRWTTARGTAGGTNPTQGAYLIATVQLECLTGACSPGAARFVFQGNDGRLFYASGPIANGYVPALGYAPPIQSEDLARPLAAGQSVTGIAAVDAPRAAGAIYLVAINTSTTVATIKAPSADLKGAVGSWRVAA
jgi:hypothetical protein